MVVPQAVMEVLQFEMRWSEDLVIQISEEVFVTWI
jgi:hypothetical protein